MTASSPERRATRAIWAGGHLLFWSLMAPGGLVAAQEVSPDRKPDTVAPASANAPPDKISAPVLPKDDSPDTKAENRAPELTLDREEHKNLPDTDPTQRADQK